MVKYKMKMTSPLDEDLLWDENDQLHDENEQPPLHDEGLAQDVIEDSE